MNNKFKIRKLENDIRSLQKQIEELKSEDSLTYESELVYSLKEEVLHKIHNKVSKEEETAEFFVNDIELRRFEDICIFIIRNKRYRINVSGIAKKHKDDEFDFDKGFKIAEHRARVAFEEEILKLALIDKI